MLRFQKVGGSWTAPSGVVTSTRSPMTPGLPATGAGFGKLGTPVPGPAQLPAASGAAVHVDRGAGEQTLDRRDQLDDAAAAAATTTGLARAAVATEGLDGTGKVEPGCGEDDATAGAAATGSVHSGEGDGRDVVSATGVAVRAV